MEPSDLPQNFLQQDDIEDVVEYEMPDQQGEDIEYAEWVEGEHGDEQKYILGEDIQKDFDPYDANGEPVFLDEGNDVQIYDDQQYEDYDEDQHDEDMAYETQIGYEYGQRGSDEIPIVEKSKRKSTVVECEYCGQILRYPSKIQAHMRTHTGEKPFVCSICGARFSQKVPMMNHVRKHMGDTPYQCSFCPKKFVLPSQKNAHELRHQGIKRLGPPKPHLKPPIRRIAPIKTEFIEEEDVDIKPVMLNWTPAIDNIAQPLSAAAAKRIDEVIESVANGGKKKTSKITTRPVMMAQCNICGLMLKHASKIQEHMRVHTGEKPFGCTVCGLRFSRLYSLKIHMKRKHTVERKITCTWDCGMHFVNIAARNEHERIVHAGIKRYLCNIPGCRRMFTRRIYLMSHRMKDHPNQHQPLFDPHEIAAAEEIEHQLGNHDVFQNEEVLLSDEQLEKLIELPDGMIVLPEGAQILEGEFIDEEEEEPQPVSAQMYLEEQIERLVNARGAEINDAEPFNHNVKEESRTIKQIAEASSEDHKAKSEISETVKHIWMEGEGLQKKRMTIRILKRS